MEYNNRNIDLVKSLIHFFKFSETNKLVLFNLKQKTFEYVQDFDQVSIPAAASPEEQQRIRSPLVLIDCRSRHWNDPERISNYMANHALTLQLPLYIATPSKFLCVIPSSSTLINISHVQGNNEDLEKLKLQYYSLLKTYLLDQNFEKKVIEEPLPSTFTLDKVFAVFRAEGPVLL